MHPIAWNRERSSWRKIFKKEWKRCETAPISDPNERTIESNIEYRPDVKQWVCTCPYLAKSRFLVCKHLVQLVEQVPPRFFLEVRRNSISQDEDDEDEQVARLIRDFRSFANGLEYQTQFRGERMFDSILRYGGGFLCMMDACLEKERRQNSNTGSPVGTWDRGTASAMYYCSRPRRGEEGT
ncbi:hypothetical protein GGU10DRAFT_397907 [Lentinula aff. detonsa]|uniref:SWIM-type domain-containing protein n=1 Tax=Lentinula aff. detonsa TaxID=2804958 RepID=A0AA38KCW9_9AGAR|nr:hypothetical protein GGU10DRAFT_397907 [Lentinula aff. detonsa]